MEIQFFTCPLSHLLPLTLPQSAHVPALVKRICLHKRHGHWLSESTFKSLPRMSSLIHPQGHSPDSIFSICPLVAVTMSQLLICLQLSHLRQSAFSAQLRSQRNAPEQLMGTCLRHILQWFSTPPKIMCKTLNRFMVPLIVFSDHVSSTYLSYFVPIP